MIAVQTPVAATHLIIMPHLTAVHFVMNHVVIQQAGPATPSVIYHSSLGW
jgi:hypothetical protein